MKSEAQLSLLARQWGATAVPFGLVNAQRLAGNPGRATSPDRPEPDGRLAFGHALERPQRRGQERPGRPLDARRWTAGSFCPVCLTQATLSGTAILAALAAKLGKPATFYRHATSA